MNVPRRHVDRPGDLQNAMTGSGAGPHSRFMHLCLNGLYWGMYELHERPDEHFAAEHYGDDYDRAATGREGQSGHGNR